MHDLAETAYLVGYIAYSPHVNYDSALSGCWRRYVAERQAQGRTPTVAAQLLYRTHFQRGWRDAREELSTMTTCCICHQELVAGMYSERYSHDPNDDRRVCGACVQRLIREALHLLARVRPDADA